MSIEAGRIARWLKVWYGMELRRNIPFLPDNHRYDTP